MPTADQVKYKMVIEVTQEDVDKMRELAEGNEELEAKTDQELVSWMEDSIQSDFWNGDLMADQFDY